MMTMRCGLLALSVAATSPGVALAHHSTEVFYDRSRTVEFVAVLLKVDMVNPHAWFHFQEIGQDGTIKTRRVEADIPNQIRRGMAQQLGATREFELGNRFTVQIEPAWASDLGSDGYLKGLVFPDGVVYTCC